MTYICVKNSRRFIFTWSETHFLNELRWIGLVASQTDLGKSSVTKHCRASTEHEPKQTMPSMNQSWLSSYKVELTDPMALPSNRPRLASLCWPVSCPLIKVTCLSTTEGGLLCSSASSCGTSNIRPRLHRGLQLVQSWTFRNTPDGCCPLIKSHLFWCNFLGRIYGSMYCLVLGLLWRRSSYSSGLKSLQCMFPELFWGSRPSQDWRWTGGGLEVDWRWDEIGRASCRERV